MNENKKPQNPNAFPSDYETTHNGMTLRDYFANSAMQTLINKQVNTEKYIGKTVGEVVSELSYGYADAMLKQREQ